jgi:uncharacterized membrane protein YvbJ
MTKFCPNCGKPVTDEITKICSNCGTDLTAAPPSATDQVTTSMNRQEILGRAIPFFATKSYAVQTQTDYVVAFESQSRDVSWVIFLVLCCLGLIPAVIYYYWFTHQHQVTVSLSGATDIKVTAIGNTEQAKKDAAEFMKTLV